MQNRLISTTTAERVKKGFLHSLDTLITKFLQDLENSGKSHYTIKNYRSDLERFSQKVNIDIAEITPDILRNYFSTLKQKSLATRARNQSSLWSFFNWCFKQDILFSNPMDKIEKIKLPEPRPKGVEQGLIEKVLKVIPNTNLRDKLLFTLITETGLRVSEAINIYIEDIDKTPDDEKMIIRGKGNKTRTVMLYAAPESLMLLNKYINQSGIKSGALFRGDDRKGGSKRPMRYNSVYELWQKYTKKAGVGVNIHALRHTYATRLVNEGVDLDVVRKLLGHKNMQTTMRYAETNDRKIKQELMTKHRRKV